MASDAEEPRSVKLSTFSYTPLDAAAESDLEHGRKYPADPADDEDDSGGLEEELVGQHLTRELHSKQRARRGHSLLRQVGLFAVGALTGASILSAARWTFTGVNRLESSPPRFAPHSAAAPVSSSSSSSTSSPDASSYDFASNPPVRVHYRERESLNTRPPLLPPLKCPVPVVYTLDPNSADIVVFNSDSQQGLDEGEMREWRATRPWQKLAVAGVESAPNRETLERHFDKLREGKRNETYDYEMTYRLNSTVPTTYSYGYFNYLNPPVPYASKRHDRIAASFISNCRPKNARTRVLDELTRLLPGQVDNFGRCHNNADADDALREIGHYDDVGASHNNWNTKITTINYYLFSVAFENSNDYDYVTEKYFQALERGSVPIVFGAPNYGSRFFPARDAAIDVADYLPSNYTLPSRSDSKEPEELSDAAKAGLAKLADRLTYLASEEGREEYEAMLRWKDDDAWKTDPNNPLGKIVALSTSPWDQDCRLARVFRGEDPNDVA
ncbi:hypothetical protein JCM11491_004322 [Sporobolomyces phaffii]